MEKHDLLSRRTFVKHLSIAAAIPWLPKTPYPLKENSKHLKATAAHQILSCNIRVALPADDEAGHGWADRKGLCIEVMRKYQPDIICLQEVLKVQNEDLKKAFPDFLSFGFEGPEMDAHEEGYHGVAKNPIFFSTKRYQLMGGGVYWLSEKPYIGGSKSWGTARARHVNWVRLKDKHTSTVFRILNLHLDHVSQEAREQQTKMMLEEAGQYPGDFKQFLTGDFNASADNNVVKFIKAANWTDTYTSVHGEAEPGFTVHSFQGEAHPRKEARKKIDFIFFKGGNIQPLQAEIIKDHEGERYPSDHYFISAKVRF